MILDATAGNRSIYEYKKSENIIFIDIEKQLWIKPTLFADSRKLPFKDKTFHTIIFDPPHDWGDKPFDFTMGKFLKSRQWGRTKPYQFTYYGWDKYKRKNEIIRYIYESQKEFARVATDDALLLLKWCEVRILINRILQLFTEWRTLIEIHVGDPTHTYGTAKTYWIIMEKRKETNATIETFSAQQQTTPEHNASKACETLLPFVQEHQAQQQ
jgi:hypothetical protein